MAKFITDEGFIITDLVTGDVETDNLFYDEIVNLIEENPNKKIIIAGDSSRIANHDIFFSLLRYENVSSVKNLYILIKNENLKKVRKDLLINEFRDFFKDINDTERIVALLNVLSEKFGLSNIKNDKSRISFEKEGQEHSGFAKYGRSNDFCLDLDGYVGIVEAETGYDSMIDSLLNSNVQAVSDGMGISLDYMFPLSYKGTCLTTKQYIYEEENTDTGCYIMLSMGSSEESDSAIALELWKGKAIAIQAIKVIEPDYNSNITGYVEEACKDFNKLVKEFSSNIDLINSDYVKNSVINKAGWIDYTPTV